MDEIPNQEGFSVYEDEYEYSLSERRKTQWQSLAVTVVLMVLCGFCGVRMVLTGFIVFQGSPIGLLVWLAVLVVIMMLQIVIHEAGHLVFGLMSGYTLSSFRVLSFMLIKTDGRWRIKRLKISGTGGQCLMAPPDMVDGKFPVRLYNLGGVLMNLISAAVAVGIYFLCPPYGFWQTTMMIFAAVGLGFALLNGIPMSQSGIDNDGKNALSIEKDRHTMRAFWLQMKINEQNAKGVRLKDMPAEWFERPIDEALQNSMVAASAVFVCNRLMDEHSFEQANEEMARLLNMRTGMAALHRAMLVCDRMYLELIGDKRSYVIGGLNDGRQKRAMRTMKSFPSVIRTEYTNAILGDVNDKKAKKLKSRFEKVAASYPYACEIESELELIAIAEAKAAEKPVD